jgi:hypothetical protein
MRASPPATPPSLSPGSQDTIARATESESDAETLMQRQSTRTEEQIKTKEGEVARQLRVMAQAAEEKLATKQAEVDRRLQVLGEENQVRTLFGSFIGSTLNFLTRARQCFEPYSMHDHDSKNKVLLDRYVFLPRLVCTYMCRCCAISLCVYVSARSTT